MLCLCLLTSNLWAQLTPAPSNSGSAVINYQVLNSRKVNAGNHFVTFNRVAPVVFPKLAPQALPTPPPSLTPQELQAIQDWENKPHIWIMIEATVYDNQTTDLRWYYNGHQTIHALSNINFDYLTSFPELETANAVYEYWIMVSDDTSTSPYADPSAIAWVKKARQQLPNLIANPNRRSSYFIAEGDTSNPATNDGILALNALHAYYDANSSTLIPSHQKAMADYAAKQQNLKDHPPKPKDSVVNFWPVKSSVYLKGANQ